MGESFKSYVGPLYWSIMLAVPTYATVLLECRSVRCKHRLKYPLVYTNNMSCFAKGNYSTDIANYVYMRNQFITIDMHIKEKQNIKLPMRTVKRVIHFVNYISLSCW